jgi:hypothetical protein
MRNDWRKGPIRTHPRPGMLSRKKRTATAMREPVRILRRVMLGLLGLGLVAGVLGTLMGG